MFFVQRRRLEALCAVALRRHAAWHARREALQALLHVLEVLRQLQSAISKPCMTEIYLHFLCAHYG